MTVYSAFASSILGMTSQAHSLATISQNIANVSTGGFKRTETRFQTVLSATLGHNQDLGGVLPKDIQMISKQGLIYTTARDLDLAIVGDGFFVLSDKVTGGNTFYSRDGSFDALINTATTSTGTGSSTSVPGYVVDKNGYYLMGWAPDSTTGVFPTSGTPTAMRIDPDYFANTFTKTAVAKSDLNLPADAPLITDHANAVAKANAGNPPTGFYTQSISVVDSQGYRQPVRLNFTRTAQGIWETSVTNSTKQVDKVTLGGTIEKGDVYTISAAGSTFIYTTDGTEANINAVRTALINRINALHNTPVTAAAGTANGEIILAANTSASPLGTKVSITGGSISDNTSAIVTLSEIVTTTSRPSLLLFGADGISRTPNNATMVQANTVTLSGTIEAGDVYSVTVNGTAFSYTTTGSETSIGYVAANLAGKINADAALPVTAVADGTGRIILTSDKTATTTTAAQSLFTSSASATNGGATADNIAATANQMNTITFTGTIEASDVYTVTVAGTTFTYTATGAEADINAVTANLASQINAAAGLNVSATSAGAGRITLAAKISGATFTSSATATNNGTKVDNTATSANTNVTFPLVVAGKQSINIDFSDVSQSARSSTTSGTGATTTGTFVAAKGTFDLDLTNTSQYDTGFLSMFQDTDGFERSELERLSWDEKGYLVGSFSNDNSRRLYRVPLANFVSPDTLHMKNGMVFEETAESGPPKIEAADVSGRAGFSPGAIEQSNVDIAEEFTRMIMTQAAYNANSVAFKTNDELTVTARDLFRG